MISIIHENPFIADSSNVISLANNEITFRNDHKFLDGESVIYETRGTKGITGLTTESEYFVFVSGQKNSKTSHNKSKCNRRKSNTVGFTQFGNGVQYFAHQNLNLLYQVLLLQILDRDMRINKELFQLLVLTLFQTELKFKIMDTEMEKSLDTREIVLYQVYRDYMKIEIIT